MNVKFKHAWLLLSLSGVLTSCTSEASDPYSQWLDQAQFVKPLKAEAQASNKQLMVSETLGIALTDGNGKAVSSIKRKAEHLDFRFTSSEKTVGVLSSMDINTGEILLVEVDLLKNTLALKQAYKPEQTAFDAMCLSLGEQGVDMFSVNALGEVVQHNVYQAQEQSWQLREINRIPVGPNVKSCAVDEGSESLFITEENIGVWRYSTNPEHEVVRDLLQLPKGLEVEYVDTTMEGDVAAVSPSINKLWLLDREEKLFQPIDLPNKLAPKTLQLSRSGGQLKAIMSDDETGALITKTINEKANLTVKNSEAVESLPAFAQTEPVLAYGDAADDPAIWLNKSNPNQSLIYGTDKKHGLNVYDLNGTLITSLPVGRVNNVDIRYGIKVNGKLVDLAAASNRTTKSISLFAIDRDTGLPTVIEDIKTDLDDPYGLCMSKLESGVSVWINDTNGRFQRYELEFSGQQVSADMSLEWMVPSQPEGCVSDDANQLLYYGEEATGVWLKQIDTKRADQFIAGLNSTIEADIEGIGLYQLKGKNYLVVSSQGNNRYAVYDIEQDHRFLGAFEIGSNWSKFIDGASETDGLAVSSASLGSQLPDGLLVVQDGRNVMPRAPQNFKLVDGSLLKKWIESKL